jgi:hypothetical protein
MARDEIGLLAGLKACRAIVDDLITAHRGQIFNTAGNSVVVDFASAIDAMRGRGSSRHRYKECARRHRRTVHTELLGAHRRQGESRSVVVVAGDYLFEQIKRFAQSLRSYRVEIR